MEFIPDARLICAPVFRVTWSSRNHSNMPIYCSRNISYYYHQCWKHILLQFLWGGV